MDILDQLVDLSPYASSLNLAVPSGAEIFNFLGGTLARSEQNWANQAAPLVPTGSPVISATSGAAVDSADYFSLPASTPNDQSETYLFVTQANSAAQPTTNMVAYTSNGQTNSFAQGETVLTSTPSYAGPTALVGLLNSSGTAAATTLTIGGNNAATWAATATPSFFALTIDMTNLLITWQCLSTGNWATYTASATGGVAALTKTAAIASGSTRETTNYVGKLGANISSGALANAGQLHFFAKYSRALSSAEVSAVYAQVKAALAKRGVAI